MSFTAADSKSSSYAEYGNAIVGFFFLLLPANVQIVFLPAEIRGTAAVAQSVT